MKCSKVDLFKQNLKIVGHEIDNEGNIKPDQFKTEVVTNYPRPKNQDEALSFISLCNYFRKFIENFSRIAEPIYKASRKSDKFD